MSYAQHLRGFNRGTRLFLVNCALSGVAQGGILSVLLNLYLLRLGYDAAFVGQMGAINALGFCVASPLGAWLATRVSYRTLMLGGSSAGVLGFAMIPLTGWLPADVRSAWVVTGIALANLGYAAYGVVATPFFMEITAPEVRSHAFSMQMAIYPLSGFLGSLLGGQLPGLFAALLGLSAESAVPFACALALTPLLSLPGLPLIWMMTRGTRAASLPKAVERGPFPVAPIAVMGMVMALRWLGMGPVFTFFNVYLDARLGATTATIGALSGVGRLLSVPAALLMPLLIVRFGKYRTAAWGAFGLAASLLPLALWPSLAGAGAGYLGVQAFFVLTSPAFALFGMELTTPGWRTAMASACNFSMGVGLAVMSFGGGYAIQALGYRTLFLVGAGFSLLCAALFAGYFRRPRAVL